MAKRHKEICGVMGIFIILTEVMVSSIIKVWKIIKLYILSICSLFYSIMPQEICWKRCLIDWPDWHNISFQGGIVLIMWIIILHSKFWKSDHCSQDTSHVFKSLALYQIILCILKLIIISGDIIILGVINFYHC